MKFFFDNSLPPRLSKGLHVFVQPEHEIVHLKERFATNAEDQAWMKELAGEEGWVIVTAYPEFGKNSHERQAWKEAGHPVIFLKPGWADLPYSDQAARFTKFLPAIVEAMTRARIDQAFFLTPKGKIESAD